MSIRATDHRSAPPSTPDRDLYRARAIHAVDHHRKAKGSNRHAGAAIWLQAAQNNADRALEAGGGFRSALGEVRRLSDYDMATPEWRDPRIFAAIPGAWLTPDQLADETGIVILEPLDRHAYIRESGRMDMSPTARPMRPSLTGRVGAYSITKRGGPRRVRTRRVWWLKDEDRSIMPHGLYRVGWPVEAVDPLSIAPGRVSEYPKRENWS